MVRQGAQQRCLKLCFPWLCSAAPGSCMVLLTARFSHSPTRSVMTPLQHPVCCWCIALASYQPSSLRSFSSDRSHTLSHASYLRDSAMIDDTMVIPSQQVSKPLKAPSWLQRSGNRERLHCKLFWWDGVVHAAWFIWVQIYFLGIFNGILCSIEVHSKING